MGGAMPLRAAVERRKCVERHGRYPRPRIEMRRTAERALRQRAQLFQVFEQNEHHTLKIIGRFARRIRVPAHNAAHHLEVRGEVLIVMGCHG